jgi:GT2 family glycosyltransferase
MRLSYVIISYNRRETLRRTLGLLADRTPLARSEWDIWVIDNASTDGTDAMVAEEFPEVNYRKLSANIGMPARNEAFCRADGEYFICLDDDSYPRDATAVHKMLTYMDAEPEVAACVARVELPDGTPEGPAFPTVLLGGATCFRAAALKEVGGFSREFFRQAEEYELSCRIWKAGWRIERFEDIVFRHDKVNGPGRASELVHRMDLRNNLIVAERFLPKPLRQIFKTDWAMRYTAIAKQNDHAAAARQGRREATWWGIKEALRGRQTLDDVAVERVFGLQKQIDAVADWADCNGIKRVAIAEFSKNLFATFNACLRAGLEVVHVIDDGPAFWGLNYRGVTVVPSSQVQPADFDGIVLSNINPAQIDKRLDAVRSKFRGPVLRLWEPKRLGDMSQMLTAAA